MKSFCKKKMDSKTQIDHRERIKYTLSKTIKGFLKQNLHSITIQSIYVLDQGYINKNIESHELMECASICKQLADFFSTHYMLTL